MRREQRSIDVGHLLEAAGEELAFTCLSNWGGLDREIAAPRIQKPGLALSGFVRHVYGDRVQVLGLTKDGHPRHPLYMPYSAQPMDWNAITAGRWPSTT